MSNKSVLAFLESIPSKVGLRARVGYDHRWVGKHLQTVHVDRVQALPESVVRQEVWVEAAHHRHPQVLHHFRIRQIVRTGEVSEDDRRRVRRLRR